MNSTAVTERRRLGKGGPEISAIGLGCMSLSGVYGRSDDAAGIALVHRAIELGVDHLDSSDMYGWGQNEELLGRALKGAAQPGADRQQIRPDPAAGRGQRGRRQPRLHRAGLRGEPEAAAGSRRSTSTISTGSIRRCRSRRRWARWPGSSKRARCAISGCARPAPSASAAPTRSTRSPRCRANIRCSTARRRPRRAN